METAGHFNTEQEITGWHPSEIFPVSNSNANLIWAKALQIQKTKNKKNPHYPGVYPVTTLDIDPSRVNLSTVVTDISQPQQWRFNWPSWFWSTNGAMLNASQNPTHPVFNPWAVSNSSHPFTLHYSLYMELGQADYLFTDKLIQILCVITWWVLTRENWDDFTD